MGFTRTIAPSAGGGGGPESDPVASAALADHEALTTGAHDLAALLGNKVEQADIDAAIDALIAGAPGALDTLNEIAAQLADDQDAVAALTTAVAGRQATSEKGQANGYAGLDSGGKVPAGQLPAGSGVLVPTAVKSGNYTAAAGDLVPVDATAASRTITLPTAPANGSRIAVKMIAVGTGFTTTIACGGSDVFNKTGGGTSLTLKLVNQAAELEYYNGIWYVLADDLTLGGLDARYLLGVTSDFTDGTTPVWDATAGKFVAEPRSAIKRVINTAALSAVLSASGFANRLQPQTTGSVKPFDAFSFTMPNYIVEVVFYAPGVSHSVVDKQANLIIEKNDGSQASPGFLTSSVMTGAIAAVGGAAIARILLEPGVEYAVGATVSLRLSVSSSAAGTITIPGTGTGGKSWMVAGRSTALA